MPNRSTTVTCFAPADRSFLVIDKPAEPPPLTTTLMSSMSFLTSFKLLNKAANTTIAVPCWSSWKTGISHSSIRRCSISKQRGAEISSKLIPPKVGEIAFTIEIISSVSFVFNTIGTASTFAKRLKSAALPSMTGIAASGPISPNPRTAEPSLTTATVFFLVVNSYASSTSSAIADDTDATPGV